MAYTINIGAYTVGSTTYEDRCLSASIGGIGLQSETIPWEGTENQPYDFKYENGEFVLDPIVLPVNNSAEIAELKANLASTDYAIIKIAEGSATAEEYAELIEQRKAWRARINELEA